MKSLAEENKDLCDEMLLDLDGEDGFEVLFTHLHIRQLVNKDKAKLDFAMDYLTGSFSFTATPILCNNAYAYEIELPHVIV